MSRRRLHVGNLSQFTSEEDLMAAFAAHGPVRSATLVPERYDEQTRCVGFVEYETDEAAERGLLALNGSMLHGQLLWVTVVQEAIRTPGEASL